MGGWWLGELADLPDEVRELAGEGDHDDVAGFAALEPQSLPLAVKALLAAPADLDRAGVLAALAGREGLVDRWLVAVVLRGFDQQPARVRGAGLGDRPALDLLAGGVLAGDDPQIRRQRGGVLEAAEIADLAAHSVGGDGTDPRRHRRFAIVRAHGLSGAAISIWVSRPPRRCSPKATPAM